MAERASPELLAEIARLRETGRTRQQIADALGLSLAKVKRCLALGKLPSRRLKAEEPPTKDDDTPQIKILNPEEGLSLMERCKIVLGKRMGEDHRGYLLDGRPASSQQIARAAGMGI